MNKYRSSVLIGAIIVLLLVVEITVLVYFGHGSFFNRLDFILKVVGSYGIGIGFVQTSDLKNFGWADDMTSPNPRRFLAGNWGFLGTLFLLSSLLYRSRERPTTLGCLGQILSLCIFPFQFLYCLVHLVLICPFAYVGYVFSSALVESITGSLADIELAEITSAGEESPKISVRKIIASNPAAAKSFLIGIPALVFAFITNGIGIFL